ncbi:Mov34/MPN/PAD-1 family protein [Blastomonas natatoria]|uniref:Mov34/MPN/PAD-1 family protein n=1 Tax=Blastomonas natatoria TaxID=34015 RepID=UPI000D75DA55
MLFALEELPTCGERVEVFLSSGVLQHFARYRQTRLWHREAGGQLFAIIDGGRWTIVEATGPRRSDMRSRFGFRSSRTAEQAEITDRFAKGLHYVGDWHTHPEAIPTPSGEDLGSMAEMIQTSDYQTTGLLMLIIGTQSPPQGLYIALHCGTGWWRQMCLQSRSRLHRHGGSYPNTSPSIAGSS